MKEKMSKDTSEMKTNLAFKLVYKNIKDGRRIGKCAKSVSDVWLNHYMKNDN